MSRKPRKMLPRCVGTTADGSQCGRRCADATAAVPLCHIHVAKAQGQSFSPLTQPVEINEVSILKKLARDPDPRVRLRAVDLLLEEKRREREKHEAKPTGGPTARMFLDALLPDERAEVLELLRRLRA